jgi:hypothetical protein
MLCREMLVNIFEQIISVYTVFVWTSQQIVSASGVLKGLSTRQNTKFKYNTCFKRIPLHFNTTVKIISTYNALIQLVVLPPPHLAPEVISIQGKR